MWTGLTAYRAAAKRFGNRIRESRVGGVELAAGDAVGVAAAHFA